MTDWNLWPNGWSKQKVDKNRPPFLFNLKHGLLLLNFLIWCTIWSKNAIRHQASNLHLVEKITRKFDALERIALCYYQTVPHIKKWKKVEFFQMEKEWGSVFFYSLFFLRIWSEMLISLLASNLGVIFSKTINFLWGPAQHPNHS